jgi:hypothetical protein
VPLADLAPMLPRTLEAAWAVAWRREILTPSAIGTVASFLVYRWIGTDAGVSALSVPALWALGLAVSARFWLSLSVSMTAVDILRADRQWLPLYVVSPALTLQAAVVSLVLALPVLAGTVLLIIPGVFLALRWSQTLLLIADGRARWLGAAEASVDLVHGQKLDILALWLIVGCALGLATWFDAVVASMVSATGVPAVVSSALSLSLRVCADAFSLALVGATYYQLDSMTSPK